MLNLNLFDGGGYYSKKINTAVYFQCRYISHSFESCRLPQVHYSFYSQIFPRILIWWSHLSVSKLKQTGIAVSVPLATILLAHEQAKCILFYNMIGYGQYGAF